MAERRPYIDFQEVKEMVSIPDALTVLGLMDGFTEKKGVYTGVCPIPTHQHGPKPNAEQFKFDNRRGQWLFKCFGDCNAGGDVIELVKRIKQLSDEHVRLWFAEKFSDRLATTKPRAVDQETASTAKVVATASQTTASELTPLRFYLNLDGNVPYLAERGIRPETIGRYGIGLCSKGVFDGYVAMPLYRYPKQAAVENPVGYMGRWPGDDFDADDGRPRYKLPDGFEVSRVVYGLNEALEHSSDSSPLIVVEGPFKVWHLVQRGYPNTVSTLTSSVSDEQAAILTATGRLIVLLFDGDEAGYQGMRSGAAKLITQSWVKVVRLHRPNLEPDDLDEGELDKVIGIAKP